MLLVFVFSEFVAICCIMKGGKSTLSSGRFGSLHAHHMMDDRVQEGCMKIIASSPNRVDAFDKVTGKAKYALISPTSCP